MSSNKQAEEMRWVIYDPKQLYIGQGCGVSCLPSSTDEDVVSSAMSRSSVDVSAIKKNVATTVSSRCHFILVVIIDQSVYSFLLVFIHSFIRSFHNLVV